MSKPTYKTYYTIEITGAAQVCIWYANKIGQVYANAELKGNNDRIAFYVNPCQFVHLHDCRIISQRSIKL